MTNRNGLLIGIVAVLVIAGGIWYWTYQSAPATSPAATSTVLVATVTSSTTTTITTTTTTTPSQPKPVPTPSSSVPHISALAPASGAAGTVVTIKGTGFDPNANYIMFGTGGGRHHPDSSPDNQIAIASSSDGTTLTFTVPASGPSGLLCGADGHCLAISSILLSPASYPVTVRTKSGTSNTATFTLTK